MGQIHYSQGLAEGHRVGWAGKRRDMTNSFFLFFFKRDFLSLKRLLNCIRLCVVGMFKVDNLYFIVHIRNVDYNGGFRN